MKTEKLTTESEFLGLKNFASALNLTVHKYYSEDARKKVLYYLMNEASCISPKLDFNGLQHFMLVYLMGKEKKSNN